VGSGAWDGMGGVRIRWRGLGKVVLVLVGGLLALQVLPSLLKPPAPPPIAADVGLPQVEVQQPEEGSPQPSDSSRPFSTRHPEPRPIERRHHPKAGRRGQLSVKVSSKPRRKRHRPHRELPESRSSAPASAGAPAHPAGSPPVPSPPPAPEPSSPPPTPLPAPAPSPIPPPPSEPSPPANDGSEEFAPH
jgi:hypothetical protein